MSLPPMFLTAADYAPDLPDYRADGSDNIMNVIPRTPKSYGPLNMPSVFSGALGKRCQGAYFGLDGSGNVNGFAGDASDLWNLTSASQAWANVSSSAGAYSTASTDQWHFALFGTRVIATNYANVPQSFLLGISNKFSNLIVTANPPSARYAAVVKSFLFFGDTSDATYGAQHQRIWWSRNGNPTAFDDPGAQAVVAAEYETSFQDLLGDGGWVQGIVGNLGNADALVFMEHAIWRVVFAGAPAVFDFYPMEGVRGTPAPGSIAQLGGVAYYLGEDGFYVNDGGQSQPIGLNKVDKTFYADVDENYMGSISSAIDPVNKLYIVFYPGAGHSGANCNKMLIYNWAINRWSTAIPLPSGGEYIVRALSFGYTLDQLYTILGYKLDNLPYPLDSRVWTGGNLLLGIFDSNHRLNFFTGTSLAATVETSEGQPNPNGVTRIINARPIVDGSAVPTVSIAVRNRQVDAPSYSPDIGMTALGTCPQRVVGRYVRARITVPAAQTWTNISGVELEGAPAGGRY